MAINKKDFINRMAENGNKTKKSCREYLDLMFDTFFELLEEGEAIKFWNERCVGKYVVLHGDVWYNEKKR